MSLIPPHIEDFCNDLRDELSRLEPDMRLRADLLPAGCSVRIGDEWCQFDGMAGPTMLLSNSGGSKERTPAPGEVFVWGFYF